MYPQGCRAQPAGVEGSPRVSEQMCRQVWFGAAVAKVFSHSKDMRLPGKARVMARGGTTDSGALRQADREGARTGTVPLMGRPKWACGSPETPPELSRSWVQPPWALGPPPHSQGCCCESPRECMHEVP